MPVFVYYQVLFFRPIPSSTVTCTWYLVCFTKIRLIKRKSYSAAAMDKDHTQQLLHWTKEDINEKNTSIYRERDTRHGKSSVRCVPCFALRSLHQNSDRFFTLGRGINQRFFCCSTGDSPRVLWLRSILTSGDSITGQSSIPNVDNFTRKVKKWMVVLIISIQLC